VIEKTLAYGFYVAIVRDYRLLPAAVVPVAAALLLGTEVLAIVLMLVPALAAGGAALAVALFTLYGVAMAMALGAGRTEIECGCGGEGQIVTWGLVVRNAALVAIAVFTWLPATARTMHWPDVTMGLLAIFVVCLLLAIAEKTIGTSAAIRRLNSGSNT
jgi:membrane protease YdiL (CAAX protease family)